MKDKLAPLSSDSRSQPADGWAEVIAQHYDKVLRTALVQTRHRALAEEVAQETFVRAYEKRDQFDGHGSLGAWLYRVTVNLSRDVMRRERLRRHAPLPAAEEQASQAPHPPEIAHRKHLCQILRQTLAGLPEPMRRAFEQTVVMGYSYRETAEVEGVSEGTIASRVARTRNLLARKCGHLDVPRTGHPLEG